MHPRLSVSQLSSWAWTLDEDLRFWEEAGIRAVGLAHRKLADLGPADLEALRRRLDDAGIAVGSLLALGRFHLDDPDGWPAAREEMGRVMDAALAVRPDVVVITTGPAGTLPWERAADAFAEVIRGSVREAAREGLRLTLEHTHSLRADVGFVHTLRDAVELAFRTDIGVCVETNACWAERNLAGTIAAGIDAIDLVQVGDYAIGTTTTPDRLVPGDGDLPLGRILGQLLDAGYEGRFELEVMGPRIEEEGYRGAIERSLTYLGALLEDLEGLEDPEGSAEPGRPPTDEQPADDR